MELIALRTYFIKYFSSLTDRGNNDDSGEESSDSENEENGNTEVSEINCSLVFMLDLLKKYTMS